MKECRRKKGQYWKYWSAIYLPLVCAAGNELALQNGSSTNQSDCNGTTKGIPGPPSAYKMLQQRGVHG
ncbi:hypothetical protein OEZ86_004333 [Tetradesmus obliquus]|nr:hypothetical protein OEZ86_004333 [Tetradesmus obliquus]